MSRHTTTITKEITKNVPNRKLHDVATYYMCGMHDTHEHTLQRGLNLYN